MSASLKTSTQQVAELLGLEYQPDTNSMVSQGYRYRYRYRDPDTEITGYRYGALTDDFDDVSAVIEEVEADWRMRAYPDEGVWSQVVRVEIWRDVLSLEHGELKRSRCDQTGELVAIHPLPPPNKCTSVGADHVWQKPHCVLGGLQENPGTYAHQIGGYIQSSLSCALCGMYKVTRSYTDSTPTIISYNYPTDESLEWAQSDLMATSFDLVKDDDLTPIVQQVSVYEFSDGKVIMQKGFNESCLHSSMFALAVDMILNGSDRELRPHETSSAQLLVKAIRSRESGRRMFSAQEISNADEAKGRRLVRALDGAEP